MPLSFAAILGGVVTLIGTSTNILVSGLLEAEGYAPLGMFEQTRIGLPIALVGVALLVLLAPKLLPARRPARRDLAEEVREFTRFAVERGAQRVLLVSALGADPGARNFYSRVKGEAEIAVREVAGAGAHLFRPSLLVGQRAEVRLGERAGIALSRALRFLFVGPLRRYVPIAAESVARAMVRVALDGRAGPRAYRSDEIATLGAVVDDDTGRGVRNPP
jgi:uncharacterized protein YbjT (DUF2867 family)